MDPAGFGSGSGLGLGLGLGLDPEGTGSGLDWVRVTIGVMRSHPTGLASDLGSRWGLGGMSRVTVR